MKVAIIQHAQVDRITIPANFLVRIESYFLNNSSTVNNKILMT